MDMTKYRALFIEESREHLQAASQLLVKLEHGEAPGLVDELFRHVHSVKGMSASMGYEPIATLAHRMEDVVAARRGSAMERALIDLLLAGIDALSAQVEQIAAETPLDEHIEILRKLRSAAAPAAAATSPPAVPVQPAGGSKELRVRLDEAASATSVRAFMVYRKLSERTDVRSSTPTLEQIK